MEISPAEQAVSSLQGALKVISHALGSRSSSKGLPLLNRKLQNTNFVI